MPGRPKGMQFLKRCRRRQVYLDQRVQEAIIVRVIAYWLFCLASVSAMVLAWTIINAPHVNLIDLAKQFWFQYGPAFLASLLLIPTVIIDCIRLTNKFVGPMARLEQALRRLADGNKVAPLEFRKDDFWQEFADEFNRLLVRVQHETVTVRDVALKPAPEVAKPDGDGTEQTAAAPAEAAS